MAKFAEAPVGSTRWVQEGFSPVLEDARKKFDDAIYRIKTGETKTVDELWEELREAQESDDDGLVAGFRCTSILNQLSRRGQISTNW